MQLSIDGDAIKKSTQENKALATEVNRLRRMLIMRDDRRGYVVPSKYNDTVRFGIVSDAQFGSRFTRTDVLRSMYATFKSEKIDTVLNASDMLDGHRVYRGQEFELKHVGYEAQLEAYKVDYPTKQEFGTTTKFITGNHDLSFWKLTGVDVGKDLQDEKKGWQFVGNEYGKVVFTTKNHRRYKVDIFHPGNGTAYALSYSVQKAVEAMAGGTKPDMAIFGHYHKAEYIPMYRNVAIIQAGAIQAQTPFMRRFHIAAHVGGWIVEVKIGSRDGLCSRVKPEFIAFYEPEA